MHYQQRKFIKRSAALIVSGLLALGSALGHIKERSDPISGY